LTPLEGPEISRQRELETEITHLVPRLAMMGARLVVVHGAVARGAVRAGSKISLLVVMASELPFAERQRYVHSRLKSREPLELVVYTPAEFARAKEEIAFVKLALLEGRVVYSPERG
jgi:predicted nucleotidyltransferase